MNGFSHLSETDYLNIFVRTLTKECESFPLLFCKKGIHSLSGYLKLNGRSVTFLLSLLQGIKTVEQLIVMERTFGKQKGLRRQISSLYSTWLVRSPGMDRKLQKNLTVRAVRYYRKHCDEMASLKIEWLLGSLFQVEGKIFRKNDSFCLAMGEYYLHYTDLKSRQSYDQLSQSLAEVRDANTALLQQLNGDSCARSLYLLAERLRILDMGVIEFHNPDCPFFETAGELRLTRDRRTVLSCWIFGQKESSYLDVRDVVVMEENQLSLLILYLEEMSKGLGYDKISYWSWEDNPVTITLSEHQYEKDRKRIRKEGVGFNDQVLIMSKKLEVKQ